MDGQKFCLKWDSFQGTVTSLFDRLRHDGELVDITLCCDGQRVRAHRMMLSACSPYFRQLIQENPCQQLVLFLKDTSAADLRAVIEFIYRGCVNVSQSQLPSFIKTAEMLQIRGLSGDEENKPSPPAAPPTPTRSPAAKRRRPSDHDPPPPIPPPPSAAAPSPCPLPPESPGHTATSDHSAAASPGASVPLPPPGTLPAPPAAAPSAPPPPPPPVSEVSDAMMKVEKVDLLDEDVAALDDSLGYAEEYAGGQMPGGQEEILEQMTAGLSAAPGPSQRVADDYQEDGRRYPCDICGKVYRSASALGDHKHKHKGLTVCKLCGRVSSNIPNLRTHMRAIHGLSREEIYRIIPPRQPESPLQAAINSLSGGGGAKRGGVGFV